MRLEVVQMNPTLGNIEKNKEIMIKHIREAIKKKQELIVFPELALTGYLLEELTFEVAGIPQEFYELSKEISILFGGVEESKAYFHYNSAFYLEDGELKHTHRKIYLPTYGLFDEGRYLKSGDEVRAFDTKFGRVGILICEDAWHMSNPYLLSLDGADYVFTLANSPTRNAQKSKLGPEKTWEDMLRTYSKLLSTYYIFVHRVGYEDGINFFGGSKVFSPSGEIIAQCDRFEEDVIEVKLDPKEIRRNRIMTPVRRDERRDVMERNLERIKGGRWR